MAATGLTIITKAPMNDDVLCCAAAHDASIEVDPTRNRMVLVLCFLHAFVQDERERERERGMSINARPSLVHGVCAIIGRWPLLLVLDTPSLSLSL